MMHIRPPRPTTSLIKDWRVAFAGLKEKMNPETFFMMLFFPSKTAFVHSLCPSEPLQSQIRPKCSLRVSFCDSTCFYSSIWLTELAIWRGQVLVPKELDQTKKMMGNLSLFLWYFISYNQKHQKSDPFFFCLFCCVHLAWQQNRFFSLYHLIRNVFPCHLQTSL